MHDMVHSTRLRIQGHADMPLGLKFYHLPFSVISKFVPVTGFSIGFRSIKPSNNFSIITDTYAKNSDYHLWQVGSGDKFQSRASLCGQIRVSTIFVPLSNANYCNGNLYKEIVYGSVL
jgi:hypothetical protein